jgi:hypothetical protein
VSPQATRTAADGGKIKKAGARHRLFRTDLKMPN